MSFEPDNARSSHNGVKILNEERLPVLPAMTKDPLSPVKKVNISFGKKKFSPSKQKKMDHYVLQTIKGENDMVDETIDFILADVDDENGSVGPSGEIREELHFEGDDEDDADAEGSVKTEEIVEHVCGKCYKTFRRLNGLKKHLDFCRLDCGYHLRKTEMLKNLDKIEKDAINMENKDICFCCGEGYDTFHLGHINCPDCPKSFKTQAAYERHIFITHSENHDFPCTICNAMLRSQSLLELHVEQHKSRGKPYACKICGRDFTRSYHLKRHQKYSSCSANESDAMNCKVCNREFYRLDNLRAHLKQHLGKQSAKKPEYMCSVCKNCFYSLSTLNIHARTHTGERPFECDLCEKKFPSLVALKKHRRYHTGEKPYTCSVCNQSFAVKEVLNRHMKRHTGDKRHVCNECGKSFIQATQLRTHAKTHLRPFKCNHCDEKFKTEKSLQRHNKIHKHLEPKGKKKKHLRKKHLKIKERTDCAICDINFETPEKLRYHIIQKHDVDPADFINGKPDKTDMNLPKPKIYKVTGDENENEQIEVVASTSRSINETTVATNDNSVVIEEILVDELPSRSAAETILPDDGNYTIIPFESDNDAETYPTVPATKKRKRIQDEESEINQINNRNNLGNETATKENCEETILLNNDLYTIIPLESDNNGDPSANATTARKAKLDEKKEMKLNIKKSLKDSIVAAFADNLQKTEEPLTDEDLKVKENVTKLLDMMVDADTLKKFGWPMTPVETLLCKVIETCGYNTLKDIESLKECDYATRLREYAKLLFKVVIRNDSIDELLNNFQIDEVISYVLCNGDEDDQEDDDMEDEKKLI